MRVHFSKNPSVRPATSSPDSMDHELGLAERLVAHLTGKARSFRLAEVFERLHEYEIAIVRRQAEAARRPTVRTVAVVVNWLSNGWLFLFGGLALWGYLGRNGLPMVLTALLSLGIAHALYPWVKSYMARLRPMDRDGALQSLLKPLDRYSCPSGHCMTVAALSLPIGFVMPGFAPALVALLLLIGWARLAAAHHYPSDLVLGTLMGYGVAWPVSQLCLR
jgi:undecaprenyl-diphosphatase